MGTSSYVYIGPAFRVKNSAFETAGKVDISACTNASCVKHRMKADGSFCTVCGEPLSTITKSKKLDPYQAMFAHFDSIGLTDNFVMLDPEDSKPTYRYFVSNFSDVPGKSHNPRESMDEGKITEESIEKEIVEFEEACKPLWEWLVLTVGFENMELGYFYKCYQH